MGAYRLTRAALGEVGPDQWPPGSHDPPSGSNYWNLESTQYFILVHDREARGLICRHSCCRSRSSIFSSTRFADYKTQGNHLLQSPVCVTQSVFHSDSREALA
jgi:hypothetical protein